MKLKIHSSVNGFAKGYHKHESPDFVTRFFDKNITCWYIAV